MAVAGPGVKVGSGAVEDGVLAVAGIVVGDGRPERVGKLVGESMTAGEGVLARSGALAHPATQRTNTLAIHAMRVILGRTICLLFIYITTFVQASDAIVR